jgi:hypothetical protein
MDSGLNHYILAMLDDRVAIYRAKAIGEAEVEGVKDGKLQFVIRHNVELIWGDEILGNKCQYSFYDDPDEAVRRAIIYLQNRLEIYEARKTSFKDSISDLYAWMGTTETTEE